MAKTRSVQRVRCPWCLQFLTIGDQDDPDSKIREHLVRDRDGCINAPDRAVAVDAAPPIPEKRPKRKF